MIRSIFISAAVTLVFGGDVLALRYADLFLGFQITPNMFTTMLGAVLIALGFWLRVWATYYFHRNKLKLMRSAPQEKLLVDGPFKFSRNPLFLGMLLILFGWAIVFLSPTAMVLSIVLCIGFDFYLRLSDEKSMGAKFGQEYKNYKLSTRRWL